MYLKKRGGVSILGCGSQVTCLPRGHSEYFQLAHAGWLYVLTYVTYSVSPSKTPNLRITPYYAELQLFSRYLLCGCGSRSVLCFVFWFQACTGKWHVLVDSNGIIRYTSLMHNSTLETCRSPCLSSGISLN